MLIRVPFTGLAIRISYLTTRPQWHYRHNLCAIMTRKSWCQIYNPYCCDTLEKALPNEQDTLLRSLSRASQRVAGLHFVESFTSTGRALVLKPNIIDFRRLSLFALWDMDLPAHEWNLHEIQQSGQFLDLSTILLAISPPSTLVEILRPPMLSIWYGCSITCVVVPTARYWNPTARSPSHFATQHGRSGMYKIIISATLYKSDDKPSCLQTFALSTSPKSCPVAFD